MVWCTSLKLCFVLQHVFSMFSLARVLQPQMGPEADAADEFACLIFIIFIGRRSPFGVGVRGQWGPRSFWGGGILGLIGPVLPPPIVDGGLVLQGLGFETILVDIDQHDEACKLSEPLGAFSGSLAASAFYAWMPLADESDANQACKFLGASSGLSAESASCPHVLEGLATMQAPGCILELMLEAVGRGTS